MLFTDQFESAMGNGNLLDEQTRAEREPREPDIWFRLRGQKITPVQVVGETRCYLDIRDPHTGRVNRFGKTDISGRHFKTWSEARVYCIARAIKVHDHRVRMVALARENLATARRLPADHN